MDKWQSWTRTMKKAFTYCLASRLLFHSVPDYVLVLVSSGLQLIKAALLRFILDLPCISAVSSYLSQLTIAFGLKVCCYVLRD